VYENRQKAEDLASKWGEQENWKKGKKKRGGGDFWEVLNAYFPLI
jgi:hypothetical protein